MSEALRLLEFVRDLRIDPLAAVIVLAILGAYAEQRIARRGAPHFTTEHSEIAADPDNRTSPRKRR